MSNSTTNHTAWTPRVRTRAAVLAAGLGASVALGAGVAVASGGVEADVFPSSTASEIAESTGAQASAQQQAAKAAERAADASDWNSPIPGDYELSATYGNSGDRWSAGHSGQDFAVPTGTPVESVNEGTVVKAGGNGAGDGPAYGNAVVIEHPDGTHTQYAHLQEVKVSSGDTVEAGEEIALSGNTGNSSGPHLHFEVRDTAEYGSAVDPVSFLSDEGLKL